MSLDEIFNELEKQLKMEEQAKKVGIAKAKIVDIQLGKVKDMYSEETLEHMKQSFKNFDEEREIIRIYFETEFGDKLFQDFTKSTHRRSNLRKFYMQYGKPEPGKEVTIKYDKAKGIWKIVF